MFLSVLLLILLISTPCVGQTLEVRRGLKECEKIRSEIRAIHDSIVFIEDTYRKKDPAYADFSIPATAAPPAEAQRRVGQVRVQRSSFPSREKSLAWPPSEELDEWIA